MPTSPPCPHRPTASQVSPRCSPGALPPPPSRSSGSSMACGRDVASERRDTKPGGRKRKTDGILWVLEKTTDVETGHTRWQREGGRGSLNPAGSLGTRATLQPPPLPSPPGPSPTVLQSHRPRPRAAGSSRAPPGAALRRSADRDSMVSTPRAAAAVCFYRHAPSPAPGQSCAGDTLHQHFKGTGR